MGTRSVTTVKFDVTPNGSESYRIHELHYTFNPLKDNYGDLWLLKAAPSFKLLDVSNDVRDRLAYAVLDTDMKENKATVTDVPFSASLELLRQAMLYIDERIKDTFQHVGTKARLKLSTQEWSETEAWFLQHAALKLDGIQPR